MPLCLWFSGDMEVEVKSRMPFDPSCALLRRYYPTGTPETVVADPSLIQWKFTLKHNRRMDTVKFSDKLNNMVDKTSTFDKPKLISKVPEVFRRPKNESWNPVQRYKNLHEHDTDPDPWTVQKYLDVVEQYACKSYTKDATWKNQGVWYWAYTDPENADATKPYDKFTDKEVIIIIWMCAIQHAKHYNNNLTNHFSQDQLADVFEVTTQCY